MDSLSVIFLFYSFVSFYFLFLFFITYFQNRSELFFSPPITKEYSLSIVVPCYNEEDSIGGTIEALLNSDYPNLKKIFVVDDCSKDSSYKIIQKYAKKYPQVIALQTPHNTGKASGAKNYGAQFVNTELIGFTDADSYPEKDAISKMIGFFDDPKIGAVTSLVLGKNRNTLLEKIQAVEYKVIAFTRKLLGFLDSIYVTPGPLAIYRKKLFDKVHGFDEKNLTEDIEITWNFVSKGYKVEMSFLSRVYTVVPNLFKQWFKQRIRWNVGGMQTVNKYRASWLRVGMLGTFILPFFVFSWFLGLTGIAILIYRMSRFIYLHSLATSYSLDAQVNLIRFNDLGININVLFFFGVMTLFLSLFFVFISLIHSREKEFKKHGLFNIFIYMFFYLLMYPFLLIISLYKFFKGKNTW